MCSFDFVRIIKTSLTTGHGGNGYNAYDFVWGIFGFEYLYLIGNTRQILGWNYSEYKGYVWVNKTESQCITIIKKSHEHYIIVV